VSLANVAGSSPVKLFEESRLYLIEKKVGFHIWRENNNEGKKNRVLTVLESGSNPQAHEEYY
jgi:hypothetical protein